MTKTRAFRACILTLSIALSAAATTSAATLTVAPARSITATSSRVTVTKGFVSITASVTIRGSVPANVFVGTLGVTLFANPVLFTDVICTATTPGFTTSCLIPPNAGVVWNTTFKGIPGNPIDQTFTVDNMQFRAIGPAVDCLIVARASGTLTGIGVWTITSTTLLGATGTCPPGVLNMAGNFTFTPAVVWRLV